MHEPSTNSSSGNSGGNGRCPSSSLPSSQTGSRSDPVSVSFGGDSNVSSIGSATGISGGSPRRGFVQSLFVDKRAGISVSASNRLQSLAPSSRGSLRRSLADTEGMSINKLRYESVEMHGRDTEQAALLEALKNLQTKDKHQFVVIQGESGTGKSALALSLAKVIAIGNKRNTETHGMVLWGKFDQAYNLPHAAFAQVVENFVGEILIMKTNWSSNASYTPSTDSITSFSSATTASSKNHNKNGTEEKIQSNDMFKEIQASLVKHIGKSSEQRDILLQSFPELAEILPRDEESAHPIGRSVSQGNESHSAGKCRLHHAFRALLAAMLEHIQPLVFVLDDIQWAERSSLDLLEFLLSDAQQRKKILIVGCCRSELLVEPDNMFAKAMVELRERQKNIDSFDIDEIRLQNLSVKDCAGVIADLLSMDSDSLELLSLAEVCHHKTQGNAFFVLLFMTRLLQESFLEYQFGSLKWKWNLEEIKGRTLATENVADFVLNRMSSLDEDAILALKLAGCLGDRFTYEVLKTLYNRFSDDDSSVQGLDYDKGIKVLTDELILQDEGEGYARWAHDKIKEAAFEMIPADERGSFKKKMGDILLEKFNLGDLGSAIFIVADLCNEGLDLLSEEERIRVARVNLEAGVLAYDLTAIDISRHYAEIGISLLPEDKWTNHQDLACSLYNIACRAVGCLGQYAELEALADDILKHRDIPLAKRLPVYFSMIHKLESQSGRLHDSIELSVDVLQQMGQKFPSRKPVQIFQTLVVLSKLKTMSKKLTPEHVRNLPTMEDPHLIMVMRVLDKLSAVCFIAQSPLLALVNWRSLSLTLEHGICDSSPATFASMGLLLAAALQDYMGGSIFAKHALSLMDRIPNPERVQSRVTFLSHFFCLPWSEPVNSMVKPIFSAYEVGLRSGDVDSAVYAIGTYIILALIAGRSLEALSEDCRTYFGQMKELGRERMYVNSNIVWQLILNFRGASEDHLTLTGYAMNEAEFLELAGTNKAEHHLFMFYHVRAMLYAVFAEHQLGAEHAIKNSKEFFSLFPGFPAVPSATYYFAIVLFSEARRTRSRVYIREAKEMVKRMKSYIAKGNPNVGHYMLALDAEMLAWTKRNFEAKQKYEAAIVMAVRSGLIHDAAIMNERYGEFLQEVLRDTEKAMFYLEEAFKMYVEWGCQKKADLMLEAYRERWRNPREIYAINRQTSKSREMSSLFFDE